jgi:tRNA (cmo5U34)-methyltransferase
MTTDPGAGGYHWRDSEQADRWDARQRDLDAERAEGFTAMLEQLPSDPATPLLVVDLGAGDGKVASAVLRQYPNATADLVDFSEPMMGKGASRLVGFEGRYRYVYWDMNHGDWPAALSGPFHAVVSSAAIHHLSSQRKEWLAAAVLARLVPGGVFATYDLFRDADAVLAEDEVHARTCATADEAIGFLRDAGYAEVLLTANSPRPKHHGQLALLVGRAP